MADSDSLSSGNIKHSRFYFPDGSFEFNVENTTYSIHRWWVARHSPEWPQMLGNADSGAPVLEDVTVPEMDALLSVIYPKDVRQRDLTSVEDWTSVLRLSTRWGFASCRQLALGFLRNRVPALDKLVLAHELDIPDWLDAAYVSLCLRNEPLTLAEGQRLSLADVIAISTTREAMHREQIQKTVGSLSEHVNSLIEKVESPLARTASSASPGVAQLDETPADTPYLMPDSLRSSALQPIDEFTQEAVQSTQKAIQSTQEVIPATNGQPPIFPPASPTKVPMSTVDTLSGNETVITSPARSVLILNTPSNDSEQLPLPQLKQSTTLPPPRRAKAKAISQGLYAKLYEFTVDGINPHSVSLGHLAPTIAEWANKDVMQRGPGSMRAFVSALFSRAIRDVTFDNAATAILKDLRRDINSDVRDTRESEDRLTLRGAGLIDDLIQSVSTYALLTPITQEASGSTRSIIFKASETALSSEEFTIRKHNASVFTGKLLKDGLLKPHHICEGPLKTTCAPEILRDKLPVLGPFLERFGGSRDLDELLASYDARVVGDKANQAILQEICDLRSRRWVASNSPGRPQETRDLHPGGRVASHSPDTSREKTEKYCDKCKLAGLCWCVN